MQLKYYKELDGVRGLAVIMVMLFHYINGLTYSTINFKYLKKVAFLGQTGVSLFFVLSGFLITRILINQKDRPHYFRNFYYRRVLRILPLYLLFLILYFIITSVLNQSISFKNILYYLFYIQNFAMTFGWKIIGPEHLWSLAVEEHFYLIWPLIIYFVHKKNIPKIGILMIILSAVVRIYLLHKNLQTFYFTFSRLDELSFGSLLAIKELKDNLNKKEFKFHKTDYLIFTVIILFAFLAWAFYSGKSYYVVQIFKYSIFGYIYYITIGFVIQINFKHWLKKIFLSTPLCFSGRISYGLYIYHPLCYFMLRQLFNFDLLILNIVCSLLFTYFVAYLSYNYFEYPFIKLKSKIAN
jgi:peptidoglycan/LPS O-acetylase OafA/YrhL